MNVEAAYTEIEKRKKDNGLPIRRAPHIFRHVASWQRKVLTSKEILNLQYHVGITDPTSDSSSKMFLEVQSTQLGVLASQVETLKSLGDKDISGWLAQINSGLFTLVREDCPPLFTLNRPMLVSGHIPDGNHRAFAAAVLALKGEQVCIPVYEGSITPKKWLAINLFYFLLGAKKDPDFTLQVVQGRWRSRS